MEEGLWSRGGWDPILPKVCRRRLVSGGRRGEVCVSESILHSRVRRDDTMRVVRFPTRLFRKRVGIRVPLSPRVSPLIQTGPGVSTTRTSTLNLGLDGRRRF